MKTELEVGRVRLIQIPKQKGGRTYIRLPRKLKEYSQLKHGDVAVYVRYLDQTGLHLRFEKKEVSRASEESA